MLCKGFLFDLDGTLVDSLPVVERSWQFWAESYGVDPQAVLDFIHGKQAITTLRHFMPGKSEEEIQAEFLRLEHIEATDLDGIQGLGPALTARILVERARQRFQDWPDLIARVKGIGPATAARLSDNGLTVNGAPYAAPQTAPPARTDSRD